MRIMLKRILMLGLLCSLALAVSCDSSSKGGGGTATGYTQADLAGEWALRGGKFLKAFLKFDSLGHLTRWKHDFAKVAPWVGQITVASDGRLSGKVAYESIPGDWLVLSFKDLRFISKDEIIGKIENYWYFAGMGKWPLSVSVDSVRMTRYIPD